MEASEPRGKRYCDAGRQTDYHGDYLAFAED
jgi:hypothetical protein